MQQVTVNQAQELYGIMTKIDTENPEFKNLINSANIQRSAPATKLLKKIAMNCSEKEFVDFVVNNESPAIKLTNEEMEVLKGGFTPYIAGAVIGFGLAVVKKYCF